MNLIDNYHNELCELIYKIPLNKDGWVIFAKRIIEILNASYVHIQAIDFNSNSLSFSNGIGIYSIEKYALAELAYLRFPVEDDPRWGKFLDKNRKGWYQCHSHVDDEFVKCSDLYQKILLPIDARYVATHELIWNEKVCVFWSISTSQQRKPLNQQELAFLDSLLPHLRRVIISQKNLYEFSQDNIVGYNLIDNLSQPIVLLNLSGQVVHLNKNAKKIFEGNPIIKIKNDKLCLSKIDQDVLSEYLYKVEESFRYKQAVLESFQNFQFILNNSNSNFKFKIIILASEKEMSFFGIRPLVMLNIENISILKKINYKKIESRYDLSYDILKEKYKLSKREMEVCDWFVNGMKLEQIAGKMNITNSTIRTYAKNIFIKTACHSQVELMKFLINLSQQLYYD